MEQLFEYSFDIEEMLLTVYYYYYNYYKYGLS